MKPARFAYHRAESAEHAVELLADLGEDALILAGGQSLVPIMAFRLATPAHLVDINRIAGLDYVTADGDGLRIGALARHARFHEPVVEGPLGALLAAVVRHVAHLPIRTRGTFCGSLAHADPAAEWCVVAATLEATLIAQGREGRREIAAADFFEWAMTTALQPSEMLVEARLPALAAEARWGFYEVARRAGDYAVAMALAAYRPAADGTIAEPRVGLGGAEAVPRRIAEAERALAGAAPGPQAFAAAAEAAAEAIEPMEDLQADAAYRRDVVRAAVRRALERAAA